MAAYLLIIIRVFSELVEPLSALIGALFIGLFFGAVALGKIRKLYTDYFFIKFLLVFFAVNAVWGLISYYNFGSLLTMEIAYELAKPLSLICFYWLMRNGVLLRTSRYNGLLMTIIFIYGMIGYYSGLTVAGGMVDRASWPAAHHNYIGVTFAILFLYVIFSDHLNKMFRLVTAGGLFIGLGATKSLSALLLFGTAIGLYYLFKRSLFKIAFMGGLIVVVFVVAGEFFWQDRMIEFSDNLQDFVFIWQDQPESYLGESSKWRIVNWSLLFNQFEKRPILGWGTLSYMIINPMRTFHGTLGGFHPHSEFIKWLVSFGLIGTSILLWVLLYHGAKSIFGKYKDMPLVNAIALGSIVGTFFGSGFMYHPMMMIIVVMICHGIESTKTIAVEENGRETGTVSEPSPA
ncbi:MAG: O-antigen ligase family protein [Oceanidesulfovibrio sp.]